MRNVFFRHTRLWKRLVVAAVLVGLLGASLVVAPTLTGEVSIPPTSSVQPSIKQLTNELLQKLPLAKDEVRPKVLESVREVASKRLAKLESFFEQNPRAASALILPESILEKARVLLGQDAVEQYVEREGVVSVVAKEAGPYAGSPGNESYDTYLHDSKTGEMYKLYSSSSSPRSLVSNLRVVVTGHQIGSSILTNEENLRVTIAHNNESPEELGNATTLAYINPGNRTILAILVNFSNNTGQPISQAGAQTLLFGSSNSLNSYYKSTSYDSISFSGAVTPWATLSTPLGATCDYYNWANEANSIATGLGYNPNSYTHVMYIFPSLAPCSFIGLGEIYGDQSWIFGYTTLQNTAHEMGHNLGMDHAGAYSCGGQAIAAPANCSFSPYGNPWDTMGNQASFNLTAPHKFGLGFIPLSDIQTVTSNGTYSIAPLSASSGVRTLKIRRPETSQDYYLEYRQPNGQDTGISANATRGIAINLWSPSWWAQAYGDIYSADGFNYMLDLTPGSGGGFGDGTLSDGGTFTDSTNGITVTQLSHNSSSATVSVAFSAGSCSPAAPTLSLTPSTQTAPPGSPLSYNLSITNNDNPSTCGIANFSFSPSLPSGWTGVVTPSFATVSPGTTASVTLTPTSPSGATNAVYTVGVGVSETGVAAHTQTPTTSFVVYSDAPPPTPTPTPSPTPTPPPSTPNIENPEATPYTPTFTSATPTATTTKKKKKTTSTPSPTPTPTPEPVVVPSPEATPTLDVVVTPTPPAQESPSFENYQPAKQMSPLKVFEALQPVQKIGTGLLLISCIWILVLFLL